jgi:hypothetical protein
LRRWQNSQNSLLLGKLYWNGNVVMSELDALMYVILIEAEKHVPHEELAGSRKCIMP